DFKVTLKPDGSEIRESLVDGKITIIDAKHYTREITFRFGNPTQVDSYKEGGEDRKVWQFIDGQWKDGKGRTEDAPKFISLYSSGEYSETRDRMGKRTRTVYLTDGSSQVRDVGAVPETNDKQRMVEFPWGGKVVYDKSGNVKSITGPGSIAADAVAYQRD